MAMSTFPTATAVCTGTAVSIQPAITTTFVPPPQCTQNHLTMLQNQQFELWLNAPFPVPNITISSCYPDEFMRHQFHIDSSVSYPAFSPLICPGGYSTVYTATSDYFACCPSGYSLAEISDPPHNRPASGGTCYSNIKSGQTLSIFAYDTASFLGPTTWPATTEGAQAYAYPIDGFSSRASPTNTAATTSSSSIGSATLITSDGGSGGLNTAAQVGTVIGCVTGGLGLVATIIFGFRTISHWRARDQAIQKEISHLGEQLGDGSSKTFEHSGRVEMSGARNSESISRTQSESSTYSTYPTSSIYSHRQFSFESQNRPNYDMDLFGDGGLGLHLLNSLMASSDSHVDKGKGVEVSEYTRHRPFSFEISNSERPGWALE